MRFVHAADVHLDSPLRGLARHDGAPVAQLRDATRGALRRLVDHCLEERVELLLVAGDLYDGDWKDFATGLFFVGQMNRLREVGTRVVILRGNHDAASQITRSLRLPDHVRELATNRVETMIFEDLGVAIHGRGFARREESDDLSEKYPAPLGGLLNVGMLHTSADGRPGHATYAPCRPSRLVERGYDYWALGHVHAREVLHERPWVVFPGNLQGRHARETGPKGATLVSVEDTRIRAVESLELDVVRWELVTLPVTEHDRLGDVLGKLSQRFQRARDGAGDRPLVVRVRLEGAAHAALLRDLDDESFGAEVRGVVSEIAPAWIEKIELALVPPSVTRTVSERKDAIGALARALGGGAERDPQVQKELAEALSELRERLAPLGLESDDPRLRLEGEEALAAILSDAERWLVPSLVHGDDGEPT